MPKVENVISWNFSSTVFKLNDKNRCHLQSIGPIFIVAFCILLDWKLVPGPFTWQSSNKISLKKIHTHSFSWREKLLCFEKSFSFVFPPLKNIGWHRQRVYEISASSHAVSCTDLGPVSHKHSWFTCNQHCFIICKKTSQTPKGFKCKENASHTSSTAAPTSLMNMVR